MSVLIVGANGLLGSNTLSLAAERWGRPVGTYHTTAPSLESPCRQVDIRDQGAVANVLDDVDPKLVVNCAAMTDVDGCEADPETAHAVNARAPGRLASLCEARDIAFTHVSTDYVFDGRAETPYEPDTAANPIQAYGRTKLAGERAVGDYHSEPTIVRLSFVYGIHRGRDDLVGFPAWVRDRLRERTETPLFTDQRVTPTRAGQAAETILDLHERGLTGCYHVACRSCVTPHAFGTLIRDRLGVDAELLAEGTMADVDRAADRPAYTCLDASRVESALGRAQPTLADDLDAIGTAFE